jgi:hypothetical protein
MMNWDKDLNDACLYASAAKGMKKNQKIDNETLYHIICLSAEKFASSLASMVNYIPMHSGLTFVMRELAKRMELPPTFVNETKFLNSFMVYCSLDFQKPKDISDDDVDRMIKFVNELKFFTAKRAVELS